MSTLKNIKSFWTCILWSLATPPVQTITWEFWKGYHSICSWFHQNILLRYQKEPHSNFWDHTQVTLHTTVAYYKCNFEEIITEYIYHITPDKSHDWKAVDHFTKLSIDHLKEKGVKIKKIHEFTDPAPNQYKSYTIFNHLSESGIPVCRHYLGSRHGKVSADHGPGNIKQWYTREMLAENITVWNAFDLAKEAEVLTNNQRMGHTWIFKLVMYVYQGTGQFPFLLAQHSDETASHWPWAPITTIGGGSCKVVLGWSQKVTSRLVPVNKLDTSPMME